MDVNYTWIIFTGLIAIFIPCMFGVIGLILPKAWVKAYAKRDGALDVVVTFISLGMWLILLSLVFRSHQNGIIEVDATYYNESLIELVLLSLIVLLMGIHGSFQLGMWRLRR